MIVDCHTHLLPDRLAQAIRRFFAEHGAAEFEYPLHIEAVLDRHLSDGIDTVWNLPYAHKAGMATALNDSMLEISAAHQGHGVTIVPGCTVHPDDDDPTADVEAAIDAGARVLKLHCSVGGYQPDDVRLSGVLEAAGRRGVPVVIHAGHGIDGFTAEHELAPIGRAAAEHPHTSLILAHFGHSAFDEAVRLLDSHPNLLADLTPVTISPVPITADVADRLHTRILFGTDAPNTGHSASGLVARLRATGLAAERLDTILSGNARRLVPTG